MVKSLEFFPKPKKALYKLIFFHFGQILFNLAHTFAGHHEKKLCSCILKVSFDHLFDNLESGKMDVGSKPGLIAAQLLQWAQL